MTDKLFLKLWKDALAQPNKELYIGEYGCPEWFDDISLDLREVAEILGRIHNMAHTSIKDMILASGMTQTAFATKFCIPIRTVQDWSAGKRKCPDYVRLMIAKELDLI